MNVISVKGQEKDHYVPNSLSNLETERASLTNFYNQISWTYKSKRQIVSFLSKNFSLSMRESVGEKDCNEKFKYPSNCSP